jgi:hypothetical protein
MHNWRVARRVVDPPRMTGDEGDCLRDAIGDAGLPWVPGAALRSPQTAWMTFGDRMSAIDRVGGVIAFIRCRMPAGDDLRRAAWNAVVAGMAELRKEPAAPADRPDIPAEWLIAFVAAGGGAVGPFSAFCKRRGYLLPAGQAGTQEEVEAPPLRRPLPTGPRLPPAPSCDPGAPLVMRRRREEGSHHA